MYAAGCYRFLSVDPVMNRAKVKSLSNENSGEEEDKVEKAGNHDLYGKNNSLFNPQLWNMYSFNRNNPLTFFDPEGNSSLTFSRSTHSLSLYDNQGNLVGTYNASNNATSGTQPWPNGTFSYSWHSPHLNAQPSDRISQSGNYVFNVDGRGGMGVHAGRLGMEDLAGRHDWNHATEGCIRTTEEAMSAIAQRFKQSDPLTTITVQN